MTEKKDNSSPPTEEQRAFARELWVAYENHGLIHGEPVTPDQLTPTETDLLARLVAARDARLLRELESALESTEAELDSATTHGRELVQQAETYAQIAETRVASLETKVRELETMKKTRDEALGRSNAKIHNLEAELQQSREQLTRWQRRSDRFMALAADAKAVIQLLAREGVRASMEEWNRIKPWLTEDVRQKPATAAELAAKHGFKEHGGEPDALASAQPAAAPERCMHSRGGVTCQRRATHRGKLSGWGYCEEHGGWHPLIVVNEPTPPAGQDGGKLGDVADALDHFELWSAAKTVIGHLCYSGEPYSPEASKAIDRLQAIVERQTVDAPRGPGTVVEAVLEPPSDEWAGAPGTQDYELPRCPECKQAMVSVSGQYRCWHRSCSASAGR